MKQYLPFKKQRDIGEILSDTFKFVKNEWKPLLQVVAKTAGPALVIMVIANVIYQQTVFSTFGGYELNPTAFGDFTVTLLISVLILLVSSVAFYTLLYSSVLNYIKNYINNEGTANNELVKKETWGKLGGIIGLGFLSGLMIVLGFVLCILPGIYVAVILGTVFAVYIFENKSVTDAISYSFSFVNKEFWITFATYVVIYLIIMVISFVFQLPLTIYTFVKMLSSSNEFNGDFTNMFDWVYSLLNAITMVLSAFLQIIFVVSTAFVYYNLNEKQNFTGTIEAIDSLGTSKDNNA